MSGEQRGGEVEQSCMRCGAAIEHDRDSRLCDDCQKHIQHKLLRKGAVCEYCDGYGMVYSSIGDIQRAMNGRDRACPECAGSGRVEWDPDLDDVHPDLRVEVKARVE